MLKHFTYKNRQLYAEDVELAEIALRVGTPFYCYSTQAIRNSYAALAATLADLNVIICYAVKANHNLSILRLLANQGCGADIVSGGELQRALKANIPPSKIVYSGVGKSSQELELAIRSKVQQINCESVAEFHILNDIAKKVGHKARIGIRVNPDVHAHTHEKITTGRKEDKFGIAWEHVHQVFNEAEKYDYLDVTGVAMHIGSQITSLLPYKQAFERMRGLLKELRAQGHHISHVDLGGGFGITYDNEPEFDIPGYAKLVHEYFSDMDCQLAIEPGRYLVGNAGVLVTTVMFNKPTDHKHFVVIDAGMNDLVRPSLYGAFHMIKPLTDKGKRTIPVEVVGPVCESSDIFVSGYPLPPFQEGEMVAILSAGAYGATMASEYNARPLVPEVLVSGKHFDVIRRRPSFEEMVQYESIPAWLKNESP